jgi:purine-cytosine permease-like protein
MSDKVTEVEQHGIAPIPPAEQTSRPRDLFRLAFGGANTFATIILGTLPIAYGLSFWAALAATVVGVVLGALVLSPMALFGPTTRTNNAVSSGAHFGVVGRCVGSFLSLLTAITFFAISVWVSGDAVAGAAQRLFGIHGGPVLRAVAYGVIAIAVLVVCIYGYRFMLLVNRIAAIPLIVVALIGGLSTGTTALYGTGLDFSSIFPRLSRVQATLLIGTLSVLFIFVGNFVLDMVSSINAFATLIVLCTSPWMVIMMIGYVQRRGYYDPADLQVFNEGRTGGRYWFQRGVNWRAMAAWIPATGLGLLCANTPMITGPLAGIAGGVDIRW